MPTMHRAQPHEASLILLVVLAISLGPAAGANGQEPIKLWDDQPPGRIAAQGNEGDTTGPNDRNVAGESVIRLGNVSEPSITIYSPESQRNTGTAVLVCPGGGYHILAWDLEGSEVCEWLNSVGVTGVLLKYRVPRPDGDRKPVEPLMDAQRAMSWLRQNGKEYGIRPDRIGVLGFSAGGNLAARLSTLYGKRAYDTKDGWDTHSCRPDFAVLIYPAYLFDKEDKESEQLVNLPVNAETPPMFLTMAFDDRVGPENILRMGLALKQVNVPCEVHLYPTGGHGYGLRETEQPATKWPKLCEAWMHANGWLDK